MSQTKAQLVAPIGVVTASGVVASGVVTASTFDGNVTGTATSIIQGGNLNVGIMSATVFAGDFTGTATGITTGSDIKVGAFTASSFTGDFTGTATSMMRGTGFKAGAVNATGFVANVEGNVTGNVTGNVSVAGSVASGSNIEVGVMSATSYSGNGSNLTGIAATNFNTQTVSTINALTTIDLSAGNMITVDQSTSTTVSLANTSEAMDVTLIRAGGGGSYNISYSTGGVDFDGTGDYLSVPADADFSFGTGDFTIEGWFYKDNTDHNKALMTLGDTGLEDSGASSVKYTSLAIQWSNEERLMLYGNDAYRINSTAANGQAPASQWNHFALVSVSGVLKLYTNGVVDAVSYTNTVQWGAGSSNYITIGATKFNGSYSNNLDGKISNFRVIKGTALYTSNFVPPTVALTNITNTKLLCCQSDSSTTAATVIPTGSITAGGDPTAGAQTVALSGTYATQGTITWPSSITWNGGTAPDWDTDGTISAEWNQIQLLTRDSGVTWYGWQNAEVTYPIVKYNLYTWGCDENGMLGHDTNFVHRSSPTQVPGVWAHVNVQRAQKKTVSATKPDGTLWMWGDNGDGRLANNSQASQSSPIQVGTETNWSLFNLGGSGGGILITKTDGTLWTWGRNYDGELGHNSHVRYSSPVQLPGTWATSQNSIMQTNEQTTGAIKADGTLWMWGSNDDGKLGLNDTTKRSSPCQVGTGTDWSQINGSTITSAIKTDGTLWVWGSNSQGKLGTNEGANANKSSPIQVPGTTWRNISSGGYGLSFATKTDNTGWLWGYGEYGTFGTGTQTVRRSSPTQIPGTWTQGTVALFPFTIAVKNGELWAWGRNNDQGGGNLGQNDRTSYYSPKQIPGTTWKYVWGSFSAAFALKDAE